MSSIYILEPPTNGKVCLKTTAGDIDIELWSKECPKACRNFVQLCIEGYYNGTIFHRVVPDFIVQGGDPTGTGEGGESIYGSPFKDEFHQRLKFIRRGLVAMANGGPNDNGSQFFFTLGPCPELDRKHSIFGKVEGDTLFNMLKLGEGEIGDDERPIYPQKIISCEILNNPFPDIVPRLLPSVKRKGRNSKEDKRKSQSRAIQNYNLLSFGDEAEDDEVDGNQSLIKGKTGKGKSAHDLANDNKLSSQPAVCEEELFRQPVTNIEVNRDEEEALKAKTDKELDHVRSKFSSQSAPRINDIAEPDLKPKQGTEKPDEGDSDDDYSMWKEERKEQKAKLNAVKEKVREIQKELRKSDQKGQKEAKVEDEPAVNPAVRSYFDERERYAQKVAAVPAPKSSSRESDTLSMIAKFKERLSGARVAVQERKGSDDDDDDDDVDGEQTGDHKMTPSVVDARGTSSTGVNLTEAELDADDIDDEDWLGHTFKAKKLELNVVRDASMKSDENFDIYDPRNAMNKRRREAAKELAGDSKRRRD